MHGDGNSFNKLQDNESLAVENSMHLNAGGRSNPPHMGGTDPYGARPHHGGRGQSADVNMGSNSNGYHTGIGHNVQAPQDL